MITFKWGIHPLCKRLWTLYWKGQSFFGTTRPFGFFAGYPDSRLLVCLLRDGQSKRKIGIQYRRRTWLIWPKGGF